MCIYVSNDKYITITINYYKIQNLMDLYVNLYLTNYYLIITNPPFFLNNLKLVRNILIVNSKYIN